MIKLYKTIDGVLHYHEAWEDDGVITEHWGEVGDSGDSREHKMPKRKSEEQALQEVLGQAMANGYAELDDDGLKTVLVEYKIDGMGTDKDLEKRHALEARMSETLGWTGLGHCDGGSIGSGTMEVCCLVVDVAIATRVIQKDLESTEFANYSRIYEEE